MEEPEIAVPPLTRSRRDPKHKRKGQDHEVGMDADGQTEIDDTTFSLSDPSNVK